MNNPLQLLPRPSRGAPWLAALALLGLLAGASQAQTPSVKTDHASYTTNQAITITFSGGPANAKDWVGVYPKGIAPGTGTDSTIWNYVDGTQTGNTGAANGSMTFTNGLSAFGDWVAYLLLNDGYTVLASNAFTVAPAGPYVTPDKSSYLTNEVINIKFGNGPGSAKDWIGLYREGQTPGSATPSIVWNYVDGTQNGAVVKTEGTLTFNTGLSPAGNYTVLFLSNDGYSVIASNSFKVTAPGPAVAQPLLISDHTSYFPGENMVFTFLNGPGNRLDWIGLYPDGVTPGSVGSTRWYYVNGTQGGTVGLSEGVVTFAEGLNIAGDWAGYFLLNDGYTMLATNLFKVVDPATPLVRLEKRLILKGEPITVTFTNGPGGAKDWIGIYKEGQTPGSATPSTLWFYVDGTQNGTTAKTDGTITFTTGLSATGNYVLQYLINDGYDSIATETFTVVEPTGNAPRVISTAPSDGSTNLPPFLSFAATITNGATKLVTSSVVLKLDGAAVPHVLTSAGEGASITYASDILPAPNSQHTWSLGFKDNAVPANSVTKDVTITVGSYTNIVLPAPLYFENFDAVPEGSLPAGWTEVSYSDDQGDGPDLENLNSTSYKTWVTVNVDRFKGSFVTYSNPDNPQAWEDDYHRVLTPNPFNVLNGKAITNALASGRMLFGDSGYRNGNQVLYASTPDYDLTGKTDVHLSFHSLWEQNQDSMGLVEYSTDQGKTWLPVVYYLDGADIVRATNEVTGVVSVDAIATLTQERSDVARYTDPVSGEDKGGSYGAFVGAEISDALAPFISARVNDNTSESKRVELFRLPKADNQAKVRVRFGHAGTDSWYFGIDDVGLYSIPATSGPAPKLTLARAGSDVTISWAAEATGFTLQATESLTNPSWQTVAGVSNNSVKVSASAGTKFYRLRK